MIYRRAILESVPAYYELLEIDPDCSQEGIKKAYHKLALTYHPDVNKSDEARDRMKLINEAYEVLSDPEKRAEYDSKLRMKKSPVEDFIRRERAASDETNEYHDSDISSFDYRAYQDEVRRRARAPVYEDMGTVAKDQPFVYAQPNDRLYSALLDFLIMELVSAPIAVIITSAINLISHMPGNNISLANPVFMLVLFLASFGYCVIFESSRSGATPGKWYFYIFVCDANGARISMGSAIIRSLLKVFTIYLVLFLLVLGYANIDVIVFLGIILLMYFKNWTLHDYLAKTFVAKKDKYAI